MALLRLALTCLVLALIGILFVPFAVGKALAFAFAFLFVVFLVLGLATVDNLAA
jgi:hypothetical protein